eukprot:gene27994-31080_t
MTARTRDGTLLQSSSGSRRRALELLLKTGASVGLALIAVGAHAQTDPTPTQAPPVAAPDQTTASADNQSAQRDAQASGDIVVTGSRIARAA